MSGHLRFWFAAFLLLFGLSTSPASSNSFAALFDQVAPAEASIAQAPAEEECLPQPGKSTPDGRHWVYRFDGHRKCWFQAAEGIATVRTTVHHHPAKRHVAAEENDVALRKRKAVVDARAELLRSARTETPQPTPPAPEPRVADAASVPPMQAAAVMPPIDRLTPDRLMPPQVDVEALLAGAPAASDAVAASSPRATPVAIPMPEEDQRGPMASWLGVLLMALGFVSLLSSSRTVRGTVPFGRFLDRTMDSIADEGTSPFAFGRKAVDWPAAELELSRAA
ncbi:hypothetical protein ACQR1W_38395 [Bradyrhizobium sp. HKCCYLS1011]|uniref:hypothetical protein n=1 Tax=Bradyrhizobium sp. HKCCYLS1011 TaxID=3420733 RepID=UPI003EB94E31